MAYHDKDQLFTAEAIRDTNVKTSVVADTGEFTAETITIENGMDQTITFQLQGSHDGTVWFNIGSTFTVAATTDDYETVTDFFPCYRVTAQSVTTAPTTGDLDVWILKARAA